MAAADNSVVSGSRHGDRREKDSSSFAKKRQMRGREDFDPTALIYAALDLGTNNCRLLIAKPGQNYMQVVDAFSRIVRLGEGLGRTGALSQHAMDRTIEALRICANKMVWHRVTHFRLIATEACRTASNGAGFVQRIADETGLQLEIIDRQTEAHLAASGAEPLIDREASSAVVFDIGGGSTEVMWMAAEGGSFKVLDWTSLAAGVVTLSERTGDGKTVTRESFFEMRAKVKELLHPFVARVKANIHADASPSHLLGTSGTVTTIAGVQMGLRSYDRAKVDGAWLNSAEVGDVVDRILNMSYEDRVRNGCIGRERADLVLAGCAILEEIRNAFPTTRIRVADRGLREGILTNLMKDKT